MTPLQLGSRRFLSIDRRWPSPNVASPIQRSDVYRSGTLSCLALCLRRKGAFLKMLQSLAKKDLAYILLSGGREPGCGLSSPQRPRTSSGLGLSFRRITVRSAHTLNLAQRSKVILRLQVFRSEALAKVRSSTSTSEPFPLAAGWCATLRIISAL